MAFTDKFVYMVHHFILLQLNPFNLGIDRQEWWFENSVSQLRVGLSAESAKDVSWPWLSPLKRWVNLTMAFTGKFVYMAYHFILLRFNPFELRVGREGWWFEHSVTQLQVCLSAKCAKNVSWPWLSTLQRWVSLTMAFTDKFAYMAHHFILLRFNPFGLRVYREGWWFEHFVPQLWVFLSAEGARQIDINIQIYKVNYQSHYMVGLIFKCSNHWKIS